MFPSSTQLTDATQNTINSESRFIFLFFLLFTLFTWHKSLAIEIAIEFTKATEDSEEFYLCIYPSRAISKFI